jgi:dTDP-4-dehydrorhamnose reductase
LNKLLRYPRIYDNLNSLSHRGDFAQAALDLWKIKAPFGIYNLTNPGWVTTRQVVEQLQHAGHLRHQPNFFCNDDEFYQTAAATLRSNAILDSSKLLSTGVRMRPVLTALEEAIRQLHTS